MTPGTRSPAEAFLPASGEVGAVLLETQRPSPRDRFSFLFRRPLRTLVARSPSEVAPALAEAGDWQARGFALAGFVAYEAGFALEAAFRRDPPPGAAEDGQPLVWLGVYDRWRRYDHLARRWRDFGAGPSDWPEGTPLPPPAGTTEPRFSLPPEAHAAKVAAVRRAIAAGDAYQANLTGTFRFECPGDPYALYLRLRAAQPVPYGAFVRTSEGCIVSQSPELFFRVRNGRIEARPMKGTAAAGATDAEERAAARALARDPKNRAENVMIVDLLRNDLGRVCRPGTVAASRLFEVQRFRTVLQMVSTVTGTLRAGESPLSLFRALFPCGSVTGAPKVAAMRLLAGLEERPRGVYCGAVGAMFPGGDMTFSVAIRTVAVRGGVATAGAGGGIVWDSSADEEYREIVRKGRYLTETPPDFSLIETMAWRPLEGFGNLRAHLARLSASARRLGFRCDRRAVEAALHAAVSPVRDAIGRRVRLLLDREGLVSVELAPLPPPGTAERPWRIRLSEARVDSADPLLRHKTTRRAHYDHALAAARADGFDEVLFLNERGEVTEGSITNVFVERGGRLFTPPLSCGLLPGIARRTVLADRSLRASELVLTADDLRSADRIWLCNALRGLFPAAL
jgi:para-aminobenzoate synthetase/4-amino-4-deoxychorismate lyase